MGLGQQSLFGTGPSGHSPRRANFYRPFTNIKYDQPPPCPQPSKHLFIFANAFSEFTRLKESILRNTRVDGWWVGNSLNFPCVDTAPADAVCDETDVQFQGQGSFVGYDSITFSRDQYLLNNSQPSQKFIYRPDLLVNAPEPFYVSKFIWRYR